MENKSLSKTLILSVSIILGLFLLGLYIFKGMKTFSDKDRVVTVKGLSEMDMKATSATFNLYFSAQGDDLKALITQNTAKKQAIIEYLKQNGFEDKSIKIQNVNVHDRQGYYEDRWEDGRTVKVKVDRYTVSQTIVLTWNEVTSAQDKADTINLDLISKDLTVSLETQYTFPELNTIKPQLIAESTKNARIAGEQFANDSQAKLGNIKTASQGQISIIGNYFYDEEGMGSQRSNNLPYIQRARVVSTIVFFLE